MHFSKLWIVCTVILKYVFMKPFPCWFLVHLIIILAWVLFTTMKFHCVHLPPRYFPPHSPASSLRPHPQGDKGHKGDRGITTVNGKEIPAGILEGPPGPSGEWVRSAPASRQMVLLWDTFQTISFKKFNFDQIYYRYGKIPKMKFM